MLSEHPYPVGNLIVGYKNYRSLWATKGSKGQMLFGLEHSQCVWLVLVKPKGKNSQCWVSKGHKSQHRLALQLQQHENKSVNRSFFEPPLISLQISCCNSCHSSRCCTWRRAAAGASVRSWIDARWWGLAHQVFSGHPAGVRCGCSSDWVNNWRAAQRLVVISAVVPQGSNRELCKNMPETLKDEICSFKCFTFWVK